MSAVEQLKAMAERDGYTQADVDALRLLADAGVGAEKAATIVLVAKKRGTDPVALARHMLTLARAMRAAPRR